MLAAPVVLLLAACGPGSSGNSADEGVPSEGEWVGSVTAYIPNTAGGGFDTALRALQDPLAQELGESVIPTNLDGAGGAIAATEMLSGPADGSSLMIVSRSISALPYTGTPEIDPVENFTALGVTHQDIAALTVPADAPYQTIEEFAEYAAANPGEITIGHAGIGGVWHAAGLMLAEELGTEFEFVPYGGGSEVGAALLAGEIDAMTIGAPETRPFVDGGDAIMLGVMGAERSALYPDVPTLIESGIDVEYSVWRGYVTNSETPADIAAELSGRLETAAKSETFISAMEDAGFETTWIGPDEFQQLIEEEDELIRDLFKGEDFMITTPERLG